MERKIETASVRGGNGLQQFHDTRNDEINVIEIVEAIWQGKWVIVLIVTLIAFLTVYYAISLQNIYKSEALLSPVEESSGAGLSGITSKIGGFANLAGISLGGGRVDKSIMAIEVLKSRQFITKIIERHDLLLEIMAVERWNPVANEIVIDSSIYDDEKKEWIRNPKPPRTSRPTMQEAYKAFMEKVTVSQDKNTQFVSIGVEHLSPRIAKKWVDILIYEINSEIKRRDIVEAEKSIRYLEGQLQETSIAEMQAIFYELIEEQYKIVMFAQVRDEYVFNVIDPAVVPELKIRPRRAVICVLGVVLGGFFAVIVVLARFVIKKYTVTLK